MDDIVPDGHEQRGAPTHVAVRARVHAGQLRMRDAANGASGQGRGRRAHGFAVRHFGGAGVGVRVADACARGSGRCGVRWSGGGG